MTSEAKEILKEARQVEVIRLRGDDYVTELAQKGEPNIGGFAVQSRRMSVDNDFLRRLKALTLNEKALAFYSGNKFCGGFAPKVVFRFCRGERCVDFRVCFNCEDVLVTGSAIETAGTMVELATMKSEEWWTLSRVAFPNDDFIQKQSRRH